MTSFRPTAPPMMLTLLLLATTAQAAGLPDPLPDLPLLRTPLDEVGIEARVGDARVSLSTQDPRGTETTSSAAAADTTSPPAMAPADQGAPSAVDAWRAASWAAAGAGAALALNLLFNRREAGRRALRFALIASAAAALGAAEWVQRHEGAPDAAWPMVAALVWTLLAGAALVTAVPHHHRSRAGGVGSAAPVGAAPRPPPTPPRPAVAHDEILQEARRERDLARNRR